MLKFGLIGGGFQHAYSTTLWKKPKYFEWSKGKQEEITFYIDNAIQQGIHDKKSKRKFAWQVESKDIVPSAINFIKSHVREISESYELLFTHNKEIYDLHEKFVYLPPHGYWIEEPKVYKKTKLISMISSNKSMSVGHKKRLGFVNKFKDHVDLYGRGFNPVEKKDDALKEYMFSIVVENDSYPTYWSEKILDCFATGTIPIYYGAPDINDFFSDGGIIKLNNEFDIKSLTPELYAERLKFVEENFERALRYDVIEDLIYKKYFK